MRGGLFPDNRHFFAAIKDLRRPSPSLEVDITPVRDVELHVRVSAAAYAYFVHLIVPDESVRYSDNYFDLAPGESRAIVVTRPGGRLTPDMVTVRSLPA